MNEEAAFVAAIRATPADNTSRLVYADWLDEHNRAGVVFEERFPGTGGAR